MAVDLNPMRHAGTRGNRRPWHGAAFIVESLVLLAFLMASLAVLMQVMGGAHERGVAADQLSNAIILASNDAEAFAADPTSSDRSAAFVSIDDQLVELETSTAAEGIVYQVERTVQPRDAQAGTLYEARIEVLVDGEGVYDLETSRYVSHEGVAR